MKKNVMIRILAMVIVLFLIVPIFITNAENISYEKYNKENIIFDAENSLNEESQNFIIERDGLKSAEITIGKKITFIIDAPETAAYYIKFRYRDPSQNILTAKAKITVDGKVTYKDMESFSFDTDWIYEDDDFPKDRYGNEIVPKSIKNNKWVEKFLSDSNGLSSIPFVFELTKGLHTIDFIGIEGVLNIEWVALCNTLESGEFKKGLPQGKNEIVIEAEKFTSKNDSAIRPASEYNVNLHPYDSNHRKMNMLDGDSFSVGGQSVTYSFTVPESGYYYIGFRYRQNEMKDFPVFRNILIDGLIPTESFKNTKFDYCRDFSNMTVSNNNKPEEREGIYLTAGESHTLTIYVNLELLADYVDEITKLLKEINVLSMQVTKITGNNTEQLRDFDLDEYFTDIDGELTGWAKRISEIYNGLSEISGSSSGVSEFSTLPICVKQLNSLAKDPNDLPRRLNELSQGNSSVAQYLANVMERLYYSPLSLDQIYIYQDSEGLPKDKSFLNKAIETIKRFTVSFIQNDYNVNSEKNKDNLNVWVNRSRQYVEIMQNMVDAAYGKELDFNVDFSLMPDQNKLVLANAAGKTPDVALGISYTIPFELAIRNSLKDLKNYEDCEEVTKRFYKGLLSPGMVENGLYALPETSNFYVLFYRKDILKELEIEVPNTMTEVKLMLPQLNRKGMDFFTHVAGYVGYKPFSATLPFIYQMGGAYYGDTALDIKLDSDKTLDAITELCELFTIYNLPYEVSSFYQHFRNGLIPIGVGDFNTYNMLLNSAPELEGLWDISLYPGYEDENNNVLRYTSGAAESCIIFNDTEKPEEAWEFLKWWTSSNTQTQFSNTLQLTYGKEYMWNTANVQAFSELPWNTEHKKIINEQLNWVTEVARVPGNYMMEREISNALNAIVLEGDNPRSTVDEAVKIISKEISRKLEEFGYISNGVKIKDYVIPKEATKEAILRE